jgi:hypothetical protein
MPMTSSAPSGLLAAQLAEAPDRPTLLMMHHPPLVTGIEPMDAINGANAEALEHLVRRHPGIERIVCGHHHRPIQARWQGTLVSVAPGIAHQVTLDLRAGELRDGAAGLSPAPLDPGHGPGHAPGRHRRLPRPASFRARPGRSRPAAVSNAVDCASPGA